MTAQNEIKGLIAKAQRRLNSAGDEFQKENYDFAVSHAYYSMFYCAEALLLTKELRFSKHSAVHSAFGEHFAKNGEIDPKLHRKLLDAFEKRSNGDYEYMIEITKEEAEKILRDAEFFVGEIKKKLNEKNL
ncbi:MAG: HEPN domain-containing protein [Elusimicrobia bacterium HGW-Elusimicrobia-2]|nr:MAG: HEPN domain-containing protein [Elusimicrobia bacterium HGW-Elusimicrobia-2]